MLKIKNRGLKRNRERNKQRKNRDCEFKQRLENQKIARSKAIFCVNNGSALMMGVGLPSNRFAMREYDIIKNNTKSSSFLLGFVVK